MDVCLLNDSFPPQIDGVANAVLNYATIIQRQYGNAVVGVPYYPNVKDEYPFAVERYKSIDTTKLVGYRAGNPFQAKALRNFGRYPMDLIHSHCPVASTVLARLLRDTVRVPVVFTYHTKFNVDVANSVPTEFLQSEAVRLLVKNIEACDEVWTVSEGAGENLRSLGYRGDYLVMENGVDFPKGRVSEDVVAQVRREYCIPSAYPVFLFVGRMMWYKGIRLILDALKALRAHGGRFTMLFVGDGADLEEIRAYADACGLRDCCIFTGSVRDRLKLRACFCCGDLFLFPSTYDTNGIVVREAAACGVASVLIRNSCASEGIRHGETGFLIEETAADLVALLSNLLHDPSPMKPVGQQAMERIYLSWDDSVARAVERYHIVLENHRKGLYPPKKTASDELINLIAAVYRERESLRQRLRRS